MRRRRLRFTIVGPLLIGLILVVMFAFEVAFGAYRGRTAIRQGLLSSNKAILSMVSGVLSNPLYEGDLYTLRQILAGLPGEDTSIIYAAVRDANGQVVVESRREWSPDEQDGLELAGESLEAGEIRWRELDGYLVLSGPVVASQRQLGTLQMAFDQSQLQTSLGSVQFSMGGLAVVLVIVAVVTVGIFARYTVAPLRELADAADEIGQGNLNVGVPIRGSEEMATLGVALERMRADLLALYRDLEQQVSDLERRARYQTATAAVARDMASMLDVGELLSRAVTLISGQLGFYHTGIFLLDPTGEWVELRAASSEGGRRMLKQEHRLRVEEESIVSYVADQGEARVVLDVDENAAYFDNPDLPETRSGVALPLWARGEILGVLDVQSKEREAFTEEDVVVLQTLADQVAMAISNARLFQRVQDALEAERRAYGEMSRDAWAEVLRSRGAVGYRCDAKATVPVSEMASVEDDGLPMLDIPITVHDQVIGTVRARKPEGAEQWTGEEARLMEALVEQLGLALESARLYQQAQLRETRERTVGRIAGRVRETLDIDMVLQTAVREISEIIDVTEVEVRISGGGSTSG